mgnify:CR=1 FL=1
MASVSIHDMRVLLKRAPKYNYTPAASATWAAKVDRMHDNQVMAVYFRMLRGGELNV